MRHLFLTTTAIIVLGTCPAFAQITPSRTPVDTNVGGSGASSYALDQLGSAAGDHRELRNLVGPSKGNNRTRSEVNTYVVTDKDLPGVNGYFLRSSYVELGPKGFAPLHSHSRRPAFLQVISGRVHQHRSDGVSFVMGPGDFTFSSDQLAHWWMNDSLDEPMKLWIVELCNDRHGCGAAIDTSVTPLESSKSPTDRVIADTGTTLIEIDLPGEFPGVETLDNRSLRLRTFAVKPGAEFAPSSLSQNPTYIRIANGTLSGKSRIEVGTVFFTQETNEASSWKNEGTTDAVVFAVDMHHNTTKNANLSCDSLRDKSPNARPEVIELMCLENFAQR